MMFYISTLCNELLNCSVSVCKDTTAFNLDQIKGITFLFHFLTIQIRQRLKAETINNNNVI